MQHSETQHRACFALESAVLHSHWALEITARACREGTWRSKSQLGIPFEIALLRTLHCFELCLVRLHKHRQVLRSNLALGTAARASVAGFGKTFVAADNASQRSKKPQAAQSWIEGLGGGRRGKGKSCYALPYSCCGHISKNTQCAHRVNFAPNERCSGLSNRETERMPSHCGIPAAVSQVRRRLHSG